MRSVYGQRKNVAAYVQEIQTRLGNNVTATVHAPGHFSIVTSTEPAEFVTGFRDEKILVHDGVAMVFLGSMRISAKTSDGYYLKDDGTGNFVQTEVIGPIAEMDHPRLPLLGTVFIYIVFQIISIVQLGIFKLDSTPPELSMLVEVSGGSSAENIANIRVGQMHVVCSLMNGSHPTDDSIGHIGYLPCHIVSRLDSTQGRLRALKVERGLASWTENVSLKLK